MALDIHNTLGYTCIYRKGVICTDDMKQSPGEIKSREVSWTLKKKPAQKRSRAGR